MTERRDIGSRLENWARVYHDRPRPGLSPTAKFCDQLRREAEGEQAQAKRRKVDQEDAARIEAGMRLLETKHRRMLYHCYILQDRPEAVCRKLSLAHRPATVFVNAFRQAQGAIESAAKNAENN